VHDFEPFIGPCRYGTVDIHIHKIFGTALPNDSVTSQISATAVKQWMMMISLENPNQSVLNIFRHLATDNNCQAGEKKSCTVHCASALQ